jgi:hypothetical protein
MRSIITLCAAAALAGCAAVRSGPDHAAHYHSAGVDSQAVAGARMDMRMESMHEMHEKMAAAKSPAERQALMADHMKAMQDGMAATGSLKPLAGRGPGAPVNHEMMGKRMDMMEMMMQMMLEREAARAPGGR